MLGTAGTANRGGGGGGAGGDNPNPGITGGSGVIVIRYPKDQAALTNLVASGTTGGSVTFENDEAVHTFTSPGTFTAGADMNVDVLIVAGGGGGGADRAGGGGAGGLVYLSNYPVTETTGYSITVGTGGSGAPPSTKGGNGSNSIFNSQYYTEGGGGGGTSHYRNERWKPWRFWRRWFTL